MLKIVFLLVSYYKLLNTNAQDCSQKWSTPKTLAIAVKFETLSQAVLKFISCLNSHMESLWRAAENFPMSEEELADWSEVKTMTCRDFT